MNAEIRGKLIFGVLLLVKLMTGLRTGIDTYLVSGDLLNVALIDVTFLGLWMLVAYGGTGAEAMAIRPFASIGAWALYVAMIVIGWEAHGPVALAARIAGGLVLSLDTWNLFVNAMQKIRSQRKAERPDAWQVKLEQKLIRHAYKRAMRGTNATLLQSTVDKIAEERIKAGLAVFRNVGQAENAEVLGSGFEVLPDGRILCPICSWQSTVAYATSAQMQSAYNGHCKSKIHQNHQAMMVTTD